MMKKIYIFIALMLFLGYNAQNFKYGFTGNFHKGSIVGVHDYSTGQYGGGLGFFAQWSLVENDVFDSAWLYITPQLEYSMQGERANAEEEIFGKQKYFYDYVALQVYMKYFFHKGNMKRDIFVFGGPRIQYMVRDDRKVDPAYDEAYYVYNQDATLNKFGYGVSLGTGVKISQHIEGFLRFDRSFSKVYPDNKNFFTYDRLLAVGLNYYIGENWW